MAQPFVFISTWMYAVLKSKADIKVKQTLLKPLMENDAKLKQLFDDKFIPIAFHVYPIPTVLKIPWNQKLIKTEVLPERYKEPLRLRDQGNSCFLNTMVQSLCNLSCMQSFIYESIKNMEFSEVGDNQYEMRKSTEWLPLFFWMASTKTDQDVHANLIDGLNESIPDFKSLYQRQFDDPLQLKDMLIDNLYLPEWFYPTQSLTYEEEDTLTYYSEVDPKIRKSIATMPLIESHARIDKTSKQISFYETFQFLSYLDIHHEKSGDKKTGETYRFVKHFKRTTRSTLLPHTKVLFLSGVITNLLNKSQGQRESAFEEIQMFWVDRRRFLLNSILVHVNGNHWICWVKKTKTWYVMDHLKQNDTFPEMTSLDLETLCRKSNSAKRELRYVYEEEAGVVFGPSVKLSNEAIASSLSFDLVDDPTTVQRIQLYLSHGNPITIELSKRFRDWMDMIIFYIHKTVFFLNAYKTYQPNANMAVVISENDRIRYQTDDTVFVLKNDILEELNPQK